MLAFTIALLINLNYCNQEQRRGTQISRSQHLHVPSLSAPMSIRIVVGAATISLFENLTPMSICIE